jgi:hypothetical protein
MAPPAVLIPAVIGTSILFLAVLGGFGALAGGAPGNRSRSEIGLSLN